MRKNILTILTFVLVSLLTLTGCGSSSNSGGTTIESMGAVVEMQSNQIVVNGEDFTLVLPFTKTLDDTFRVELSNFNLIVSGCTLDAPIVYNPTTLVFNGGLGSIELLNISGSFDQNCTPTGYTFKATQTVTKDGETLTETVSFLYDAVTATTDGYTFTVIPLTMDITTNLESRVIDVFVGNNNKAAADENVTVDFAFTAEGKGIVNSYSGITDENGHIAFNYTAPANIVPLLGQTATVTLRLQSDASVSSDTIINFTTTAGTGIDYSTYSFSVEPSEVNISVGGESRVIEAFIGNNNQPVEGEVVLVDFTSDTQGRMSSFSATSDVNGHVAFNYTAPDTIVVGSNITVTMRMANDTTKVDSATVNFTSTTGTGIDYSTYSFSVEPSEVNISVGGESRVIEAFIGNNNQPVEGELVLVDFTSDTQGRMSSFSATSDVNGHVAFNYTAPDTIVVGSNITVTMRMANDTTKVDSATVNFTSTTGTGIDYSTYSFNVEPSEVNISVGGESRVIEAFIGNNNQPVEGELVLVDFTSDTQGRMSSFSATSDVNGHVAFNYTAPDTIVVGSNITVTMRMANDTTKVDSATVNFIAIPGVNTDYNLTNETTPVTITHADQVEVISVYLVNGITNVGIEGKTVTISTPAFGDMTAATAITSVAGKAEFSYQAPSSLVGLTDTIVTLSFTENGVTITKDVNITVSTAPIGTSEYNLTNESTPIIVSFAREIKEISVQLINNDGTPQVAKTITAKSIPVAFGTISNVNVETGLDGYARFTYVAADPLINGLQPLELYYDDTVSGTRVTAVVDINVTAQTLPLPQVVIANDQKENNLTVNNQLVELAIKVFEGGTNTPYSEGLVKLELPSKVIDGVDVGSFEAYEVPIVNGVATFRYTGPNDLQGLVDNGDLNSTFMFYHEDNTIDKKPVVMVYDPDPSQGYIPVNYELLIISQDGNMTMGLLEEKAFSVILKDDQGNQVPDSNMTSVTITSKNVFIGKLLDNGVETNTLTVTGTNPVTFNIRTNTKSGLIPIDIVVDFVDPNGLSKEMNQTVNIAVFSGPATAMSISYVGVEQNSATGKYIEKFAVTVVDTYNNKVNTEPYIAVGGMVEYAVDGSSPTGERNTTSPRLWYGKFDTPYGSVVPIGGNQAEFNTATGLDKFQYVDFYNDKLVVFGEGYVYEALGKWDIAPGANLDSLVLLDDYFGTQRDNLFYAVGHNNRQDLCTADGTEYVGTAKSDTYQVDKEGTVHVEFEYDYHLTGKDIMLWVNLSGYQADIGLNTRIGEAKEHTLRGNGFVTPNTYTLASGSAGVSLHFNIAHENAPEWYQNGHFGFAVTGKCTVNNVIDSSNFHYDANGVALAVKDARACDNGGVVYVELNVSNSTTEDCTITLDGIAVSDEF